MEIGINSKLQHSRSFPGYSTGWLNLVVGGSLKNVGSNPDYVIIMVGRDDLIQKTGSDPQTTPTPKEVKSR